MSIILEAKNITKTYTRGIETVIALNDVSLTVNKGEYVAFVGPSGSGKTTLINILGCLDNPGSGELTVAGRQIFKPGVSLSERSLTKIRRELYGYIFQNFYLIPSLTVFENIMLPFTFIKKTGTDAAGRVNEVIKSIGLEHRGNHLPGQLSGGEMQRVAIARALINNPEIILADEPTGNLDTARSIEIGGLLKELNKTHGVTILLVTHNLDLAKTADRTIRLKDGKIDSQ
jgi:ABC-type lipoprotein export system ATPase subunit